MEMKPMKRKYIILTTVSLVMVIGIAATTIQNSRYFDIIKNLEIFSNLYKEVNANYVDEIDPNKIMKVGIDAMLATLDPFTNYFSESQIEGWRFKNEEGEASSGLRIKKIGEDLVITKIIEDSPAFESGLRVGDLIKSVNGASTIERSPEDVMDIISGIPGSEMNLDIMRPGENELINKTIIRGGMDGKNVPYSGIVAGGIGYISLTTFTREAGRNVANALRDLKTESSDLNGVILDLRGNGGGLLREAINVCNVFIPAEETVVTTRSKVVEADNSYKTRNEPVDQNIKLVVLIDENSASASEIVSGVMQDLDRGVVAGQLSYGKGLVQNTFDIGYNAKVKLTTSKYYIPSGRCIQSVEYKNGERVHIPDDQRAKFQTRAGRTVLDGGGVKPDVALEAEKDPLIVKKLSKQNILFNFVTRYCIGLDSIGPLEDFHFTDFDAFTKYLKESGFTYETETDEALTNLQSVAEKEAYSGEVAKQVDQLKVQVEKEKASQINTYRKEILLAIEREIISRYYYETGLVKHQLKNDPELAAAIKILNNDKEYKTILSVN